MSPRPCARSWEAAAVEDGRLAGTDRSSFERHVETCRTCADEVEALAALRRTMSGVAPAEPSALDLRRMRQSLLRKAHLGPIRRETRGLPIAIAAMVLAAVAILGGTLLHPRPSRSAIPPTALEVTGPSFEVVNIAGAAVTSKVEGGVTEARLSDGTAAFHVEHVGPGRRFLLALPDGEIEVRGTRFVVSVQRERTQSVEVSEGIVALRLEGQRERLLGAGDRWATTRPPEGSADAPVANALRRSAAPSATQAAAPKRTREPIPSSRPESERAPRSAATADRQSAEREHFAAAVDSFEAARYAEADSLFASFTHDFPADPRCEDAAFLRAVAHSRMGDVAGAAALARTYLAAFPRGLRRPEAADLAGKNAP